MSFPDYIPILLPNCVPVHQLTSYPTEARVQWRETVLSAQGQGYHRHLPTLCRQFRRDLDPGQHNISRITLKETEKKLLLCVDINRDRYLVDRLGECVTCMHT